MPRMGYAVDIHTRKVAVNTSHKDVKIGMTETVSLCNVAGKLYLDSVIV